MVPFLLNEVCKLRGTDCLHCIYMLFCTVLNADKRDCQEHEKTVLPKKYSYSANITFAGRNLSAFLHRFSNGFSEGKK